MGSLHSRERGEGKIGCILSLLLLIAGVAAGIRVVPVYYTNNNFEEFVGDLAGQAGFKPLPQVEAELRSKADALGIVEALQKDAITVSMVGDQSFGDLQRPPGLHPPGRPVRRLYPAGPHPQDDLAHLPGRPVASPEPAGPARPGRHGRASRRQPERRPGVAVGLDFSA